ncbi:hypothetical protein [Actinotalea sp. K2]|uniref:hypothetical protein n=1 Tax=Actinotalea sp. K2 TaxID=2939438 RepID=UPI002016E261|nr:hypothetical protein [Actinotalea sp. K2]MCL3860649.1 hypothetical protein [Actinotalea sp. K2]
MPSIQELRDRLAAELMGVCARTGLYTPTTGHAEGLCWQLLKQLAYIDDCEDQYTVALRRHSDADFGPLGASSMGDWFLDGWRPTRSGAAEVVAWYAELAAGFGWIAVPRASPDEWKQLLDAATAPGGLDGWLAEPLIAELPEPSLVVDRRIHCYAPPNDGRWLFIDTTEVGPPWDHGRAPVRSIRLPGAGRMFDRTILTGKGAELLASANHAPGEHAPRVEQAP